MPGKSLETSTTANVVLLNSEETSTTSALDNNSMEQRGEIKQQQRIKTQRIALSCDFFIFVEAPRIISRELIRIKTSLMTNERSQKIQKRYPCRTTCMIFKYGN